MADRFVNGRPECPSCHLGHLIGTVDGPLRCSSCRAEISRADAHPTVAHALAMARDAITEARRNKTA